MRCSLAALALTLLFALAPPAAAQFKKEKHPDKGIASIERPRLFDPVPVQPGERFIQLYYKERKADPKRKSRTARRFYPELFVLDIPRDVVVPTTPGVGGTPPEEPEEEGEDGKKKKKKKKRKEPPRIDDLASYVEHVLGGSGKISWSLKEVGPGKKEKTHHTRVWDLKGPKSGGNRFVGWAYTWEDKQRTVAVLGICLQQDVEEMRRLWRRTGERLDLIEAVGSDTESQKWLRRYERSGTSHPEFRIGVRKELVEPWKAEDTENFIVVYNTKDKPLLRKVMRDLELCREQYMELFPPAENFDAVSTVRICKDRDEYIAYGGSRRSAGYWNSVAEELVLYNAEKKERGKRADDTDTFIVLYHEAFHQYIHYSTGELPPHSWFNEGYGDFFSGATIRNGKFVRIGVNPWRAGMIKHLVANRSHEPWEKIIEFEQSEYYENASANYAQGWSMIYFLNRSPVVKKHEQWSQILPRYFETLKTAYAEELDEAGNPRLLIHRAVPGKKARERALKAAFEDVDLTDLEDEWEKFVRKLELPKKR
ncbi:MAG: DUF1570 domain-containing protein [Planctomycetota bacterium]